MKLHQIDAIGFQARQRVIQLVGGSILVTAIDFRHQEDFVSIAALRQRIAHPTLTATLVVVPAVIHEVDAAVDGFMHQLGSIRHLSKKA